MFQYNVLKKKIELYKTVLSVFKKVKSVLIFREIPRVDFPLKAPLEP